MKTESERKAFVRQKGINWRRNSRFKYACARVKQSAKNKGLEFNLDAEYLESIYPKDGRCPVLGIEMEVGCGHRTFCSPSLDRLNNDEGYVRGNVVWMSWIANKIKGDHSVERLEAVVKYLKGEEK